MPAVPPVLGGGTLAHSPRLGLPASWSLPVQPALMGPSSPAAATGDAMATARAVALACASVAQATADPSALSAVTGTTRRHGTRATWYVPVGRGLVGGEGAAWPEGCPGATLALSGGSSSWPAPTVTLTCPQSATGRVGAARGQRTPAAFAARGAGCCMSTAASVRTVVALRDSRRFRGPWRHLWAWGHGGAASQEPGLSRAVLPLPQTSTSAALRWRTAEPTSSASTLRAPTSAEVSGR